MSKSCDRTVALIGEDRAMLLKNAHVAVVGLGGVGGAALEMLARSGVGTLTVVDGDSFEATNLNRQLLCTVDTIGRNKAEVAAERVSSVAPDTKVIAVPSFATESNIAVIVSGKSYIIDAIDDVKNKVLLITAAKAAGVPVISAMGAGNRTDCAFTVTDIYKTQNDPFARVMRRELKSAGVDALDVVCGTGKPLVTTSSVPASIAAPPNVMGAMLAAHAINRLIGL